MSALPPELKAILEGLPEFVLAFSGGIDSRFLAHAALACGCDVLAINATGPHIADSDTGYAQAWAFAAGLRLQSIYYDPLDLEEVKHNSRERCYGCKKGLVSRIRQQMCMLGEADLPICDGTNRDDERVFRPGQRAVKEAGIISPLAMAGLGKQEIRRLGRETGLSNPDQPSKACLLTRLNYGLTPYREDLDAIADCEQELKNLFDKNGYSKLEFRLRLEPRTVLQLASIPEQLGSSIRNILFRYGFSGATILADSQISGYFDRLRPV